MSNNINDNLCYRIYFPRQGSDYSPFVNIVGVTVVDFQYRFGPDMDMSNFPLYHTVYESFYSVDSIMDPGFKVEDHIYTYNKYCNLDK